MKLDARTPGGPLEGKWDRYLADLRLVSPANKRKFHVIVVGSGLAGASAAASLAELGYQVSCFCFQDSPRRAHSIAAQGGINASKNYQNDGDSTWRLFHDTIKGGDFRAREGNVYRLAQVSGNIIDQAVAQGVPFAREYGGSLSNRSFGGAQVSRTFYARGQTGQQLLLGAYQALERMIALGAVKMYSRHEMLDLVVINGKSRGIVARDLVSGEITSFAGHAVVLATGGYANAFYLSTNAKGCNVTAAFRAYKKGAGFANPCFTQIHPTCIPVSGEYQSKLTLMSESLRNDGRVWVPESRGDTRHPKDIPEAERDYYLERKYPSYGNLAPRDIASRAAKEACDDERGVGPGGRGVYLDFASSIQRLGEQTIRERYGNLFEMYERITGENPYQTPMRIYPAAHYAMGGLWVDYNLMSTLPGLHVIGEANFSDHGANRLGCVCADAGPGRWLLHPAVHHRRLSRRYEARGGECVPRSVSGGRATRHRTPGRISLDQWQTYGRFVPQGAWPCPVGEVRHGARTERARRGAASHSRDPGRVLGEREGARIGADAQPVTREGWTGGRFPRVWRVALPRRAGTGGVLRRPFPRRAPDR